VRVDISLASIETQDCTISQRGEVWVHKGSLIRPLFIEVSVPNHVYVWVSILSISTIVQLDLGNVWYYMFFIVLLNHMFLVLRLKSSLLKFYVDTMTCLAVTDHTIATFFPPLWFIAEYDRIDSIINMAGITSGVETACSSGAPELTTDCCGARTSQI
jgi:hypothetical protein